jgi:hypothetical protein
MGRLVQGVKTGRGQKSVIVWVIVGIAVVTVVGWYVANQAGARNGAAWVAFHNGDMSPAALASVNEAHAGTLAARTARYQRARLLIRNGLESIYSTVGSLPSIGAHDQAQDDAVRNLEEARRVFSAMIPACADDPILEQEALMSTAKAEEALVGVPKQENALEGRGNLETALSFYRRLADNEKFKNTDLGKQAAARCKEIEDNRAGVEQFYADFRAASMRRTPFKDPLSPSSPINP